MPTPLPTPRLHRGCGPWLTCSASLNPNTAHTTAQHHPTPPLQVLDLRSNCGVCGGFPPLINNVTIYYSGTNLDTTCNAFNCAVPFFGNLLMAVGIVMAALLLCMVQQQVRGLGCA
jgi:hypothetical protein